MTDPRNRRRSHGYRTAHAGDLNPDLPTRKRYPLPLEPQTEPDIDTEPNGMLTRILGKLHRP